MNPVYTIFNDIAMGMVHAEDGEEYISNVVHLKGASGEVHTLSINQVQLLLGILAGEHPFLTSYNPLEFLLFSYQFQDKIKKDWLAVQYQIIYDHEDNSIFVSGISKHRTTVPGHPEYIPGAFIPAEQFQEHIPDVGLYGSLALINCIGCQDEQLSPIKGSFGGSFIYEFKDGRQSIRKYEPSPLDELGIDPEELTKAIELAKESVGIDVTQMNVDALTDAQLRSQPKEPHLVNT